MPPASVSITRVSLMASRSEVLPWSTCPMTVTIGGRSTSFEASSGASSMAVTSSTGAASTFMPMESATSRAASMSTGWLMLGM
jgi:hypothetical protein